MAVGAHVAIARKGAQAIARWSENHQGGRLRLANANLSGANLSGANLSGADLSGADLSDADLSGADLSDADLSDADLSDADLSDADLSDANFENAVLTGCDLRGVQVASTWSGTTETDFTGARLVDIKTTSLADESYDVVSGVLELALAKGLDAADFGRTEGLAEYLTAAFHHAHRDDIDEREHDDGLIELAIAKIRALRELFASDVTPSVELVKLVRNISAELIEYLAKHPKEMHNLRPRQFEELVAEILASYGWELELTPETRDGGYDIFGIYKDDSGVRHSWVIECKKYAPERKVGVDIVRNLYGIKRVLQGGANALLATTSDFTRDAHEYKASRYDLDFRNYQAVLDWINAYKPTPGGRIYVRDNRLVVPGDD